MDTQLKGKVAIVTGAGQGIGKGIALALAGEGCRVVVSDLNKETCVQTTQAIEALGVESLAIPCDVSSAEAVADLFAKTQEQFGQLDVLVNNAGIYPFTPFESMTEEDWDHVMNVNLKGVFLCSREASKGLIEGGRIITISSIASIIGFESLAHYCASKSGINGFTRALALELAKKKITVNIVAPGAISTPGASQPGITEEMLQQTLAMIPLSRQGMPEDIANTVVFLASVQASYITGQVLVVDGGWTLR